MSRKLTEDEVRSRIREKHEDRIVMLEYGGRTHAPSRFRCAACGWDWTTSADSVAAGCGCLNCAGRRRLSETEVQERIYAAHQGQVEVLEYAGTTGGRSSFRCAVCGWEWIATFNNVARGKACANCAGNRKLTEGEIRQRIFDTHEERVALVRYGGSTSASSRFECTECGREWKTTVNKVMGGQGCRPCSKTRAARARRVTEEEVRLRLSERHEGHVEMLEYGGATNFLSSFRCKTCGWEWETKANNVLQGKGCANCAGVRKLTEDEVRRLVHEHHGERIEMVEYAGTTHARSFFRCAVCGWEWEARADRVGHDIGCANCAGVRKLTEKEVLQLIHDRHEGRVRMLVYGGITQARSSFRCEVCGWEWISDAGNVLRGKGCANCAGVRPLTEDEVRQRIHDTHEGRIGLLEYGGATQARSSFRCEACGWEWKTTAGNILRGRGCPRCAQVGFDPASPALLYYLRVMDPADGRVYYKIGITNQTVEARFRATDDRAKITTLHTWDFELGQDAYEREQEILKEFSVFNAGFSDDGPLRNGNSELFTNDILGLDTKR